MEKIYAKFDAQGVCRQIIKTNDPTVVIPSEFEEVVDDELKATIKVREFRKTSGVIRKRAQKDINDELAPKPRVNKVALLEAKITALETIIGQQSARITKLEENEAKEPNLIQ